jgi:GntR family transcriptional repressor for pyruvate dehydrogenase complex
MALTSTRPPKAAMLIAQRIIRDVTRDGLKPGDLLPAEKSMLDKYQTGRGTLREALRLLEFQGVLSLKPGPRGGPVLMTPDASHLASTMVLLMQLQDVPYRVLVEARTAIEPMISSLAASRMTTEDLADLEASVKLMSDELGNEESFLESNRNFHGIIAWSCGNALFGYMMESLLGIMDGTIIGMDYPERRRVATLTAHEEIYAALAARDQVVSEERMREHLEAFVRYADRRYPEVLSRVIPWDRALG